MFGMVTQGNFASPAFSYMYIGNAFYMYVGAVMAGMAQAVVDDRERFRTLKSMYVAPVEHPDVSGRPRRRAVSHDVAVGAGDDRHSASLFLQLQVNPVEVRWGLFVVGAAASASSCSR